MHGVASDRLKFGSSESQKRRAWLFACDFVVSQLFHGHGKAWSSATSRQNRLFQVAKAYMCPGLRARERRGVRFFESGTPWLNMASQSTGRLAFIGYAVRVTAYIVYTVL